MVIGGTPQDLSTTVKYDGAITAKLDAISPRFGTVKGGTEVTFTGTGFSSTITDYEIIIDGINCPVSKATATSATCTTGKRPGLIPTSLVFNIKGKGRVATQGNVFTYVNLWSDQTTWGGEFAPVDGEMVYLPAGLNLLVDVDKSPLLRAVLVEGQLIFAPDADPNHERFFDAYYIFIRNGSMEVGTEKYPYTSKITFTMHGNVSDPYLPLYGNKVIGVRHGVLDMHGVDRNPGWSVLEKSALKGSSSITMSRAVDWKVGEEIGIAPTSYGP